MKPVFQTRFGATTGNCYAACIASLLEISIEEADAVACGTAEGIVPLDEWVSKTDAWFRERGLHRVCIKWNSTKGDPAPFSHFSKDALCLLSGPSPRHPTALHVVIGKYDPVPCNVHIGSLRPQWQVIHDPFEHATGPGIAHIEWIEFLVPFFASEVKVRKVEQRHD